MQRGEKSRHNSSDDGALETKQPLKRLQIALHRILKVAIPLHLDLLAKHKENIEKFQSEGQWHLVHSEQVNASRTVQQLKSDIYELETVGQQVRTEEFNEFENRVQETRARALDAINSFIEIHSSVTQPFIPSYSNNGSKSSSRAQSPVETPSERSPTPPVVSLPGEWLSQSQHTTDCIYEAEEAMEQNQLQLTAELPQNSLAARSWNTLKADLLELNALIHNFARMVLYDMSNLFHCGKRTAVTVEIDSTTTDFIGSHQQTAVNSIEYNVINAHENVQEGTKNLGKAVALKAAILPMTGAVIGGIVGGPLGLMAGFKLAGVAGLLSGGVLGFTGGKILQKRKTKVSDIELQNLTQSIKRSHSLPELANEDSPKNL